MDQPKQAAPPARFDVELIGPHTHAGVDYGAEDVISLTEAQADWLATLGHKKLGPTKPKKASDD